MHILMLHDRYLQRGGEDESTDAEVALLRSCGHAVDLLEMHNRQILERPLWQTALSTVWSQAAYRLVRQRLHTGYYDLVHVQNFFPLLSPAVYYAAKAENTPVVQALRNYRLFCLNGLFYRDGEVCERCMGRPVPYPGIVYACYRESRPASLTVATMLSVHRALRTWHRKVDLFYTLTDFARRKFIEGGLPPHRLTVKPNFVAPDPGLSTQNRRYFLLVSRLSPEKGIMTVLDAWEKLGGRLPLKIVGSG
ncbi:glycosyltransferase family 1 protein, partial [Candidatus Parcubacteria bacterium]